MGKNIDQHYTKPCATCGHRNLHGELSGCIANKASVGQPADWCDCTEYVAPATVRAPSPAQRTRRTDPETSLAAAASIPEDQLRANQAHVLAFMRGQGGITDMDLVKVYGQTDLPRQSDSGLRTRRAELVAAGLVVDTGERAILESGRQAIIWEAKPKP